MTDAEKIKYLYDELVECISNSCEDCDYLEYSTMAKAYACENPDSPRHTRWMDEGYGCKYHTRLKELNERLELYKGIPVNQP